MTEETKADDIKQLAAHGGSTRATCPWLLLLHVFSAQVLVLVWDELLGCAEVRLETGWGCAAVSGPELKSSQLRNLSRVSNEKDDGKGKGETQNTDELSRLQKTEVRSSIYQRGRRNKS